MNRKKLIIGASKMFNTIQFKLPTWKAPVDGSYIHTIQVQPFTKYQCFVNGILRSEGENISEKIIQVPIKIFQLQIGDSIQIKFITPIENNKKESTFLNLPVIDISNLF